MNTTSYNGVRITYFGHSSLLFEGEGVTIYVDPFAAATKGPPADIVLHTHNHFDHCDEAKTAKVSKFSTILVGTNCKHPCRLLKMGENLKFGNVIVTAVPAYNIGKKFHQRDANGAGYILSFGKTRIYVAGDTDEIPEMEKFPCDLACLPIGGTYTMNAKEAASAAVKLKAKAVIPIHYNYLSDLKLDPQEFKRLVDEASGSKIEVRILAAP